ncbi:hypothetical protein JX265_007535 [Neoarthrinium moseri]|uniref:Inhibitor of growth protein N-terminal histone-binding domain-containing protein n=1 Tax=Neoarthrinium moseri TaxID=1658444 RepID=A0A9P9WJR9_9PEZI|nr:hypothetical protein JX265_007535 [Neoarthrinium moseri]
MATAADSNANGGARPVDDDHPVSPTTKTAAAPPLPPNNPLESLSMRADPDAQATVTDYLDFTEYLPADVNRSLTLIGKLDQSYIDASSLVHDLTTQWGKLPALPLDQRADPVQLRADISENLSQAVSSRTSSWSEAQRMADYVNRHVNRAKTILAKLQHMRDNYPTEEQKSPTQTRSPQMSRTPKVALRLDKNGQRVRQPPRITVPGEVLAPYEVDFNAYTSSSEESSEDDMSDSPPRTTPAPRIKLIKSSKVPKQKIPKPPRQPRQLLNDGMPIPSTSSALAKLQPPPENAVLGGPDAPWLQLTPYELAKLRKRMKKNAVWNPSDTMIARELKTLGRGVEAYRAAMQKAKEEGKPFEPALPTPVTDAASGTQHPPVGAISSEALGAEEVKLSNRGMKLNEAKKLKREQLAKQAVEEAEESARKMAERARMFFSHEASPSVAESVAETEPSSQPNTQSSSQNKASGKSKSKKRKRDSASEPGQPEIKTEAPENTASGANPPAKPQLKRTKTETPVPPPQLTPRPTSVPPPVETPIPPPHVGQAASAHVTSTTPVPVPVQPTAEGSAASARPNASPSSGTSPVPPQASTVTTTVPTKPPATTPVPPPKPTTVTPVPPPTNSLGKRETRKDAQKNLQPIATNAKPSSASRPSTPVTTPSLDQPSMNTRRPASRGKASSVEPPMTLAADRPRRTSTARNTPAPELRQPSKRSKRPAPGVVSTTSGGTSAVGKRKAAPRKRPRIKKNAQSQQVEQDAEVEVDDDGNVIDPNEPRYCICNGVSFGTMIQCDNVDVSKTAGNSSSSLSSSMSTLSTSAAAAPATRARKRPKLTEQPVQNCKQEWFHLECVGLTEIPARTTKWYCPDCRVLLNIGGRGEVTSRGVKM